MKLDNNGFVQLRNLANFDKIHAPTNRFGHTLTILDNGDIYLFGGAVMPKNFRRHRILDKNIILSNELYKFDCSTYRLSQNRHFK